MQEMLSVLNTIRDQLDKLEKKIEHSDGELSFSSNTDKNIMGNLNHDELKKEIEELKNKLSSVSNENAKKFSQFEETIKIITGDLATLGDELEKVSSDSKLVKNSHEPKKNVHKAISNKQKSIEDTNTLKKIVYASKPDIDGFFKEDSMSKTDRKGKYYKFIIEDETNAFFEFLNFEDNVLMATDSPEKFIEPACESVDELDQRAKKIITSVQGEAVKYGDKWKITKKAEISYE
ncbi:hypothetical protein [Kordia jejudonensis]|uniref:hypothetical protein n=1 Tax=Kordia jejudonensis TaxID=1348245 RepID=UPI0006296CC1|nr:hypothetical protein [Kordia jejudonensis]